MGEYFNDGCVYGDVEFLRRFRMPRSLFTRVFENISMRHFFVRITDALGRLSVHPLQRVTAALRMMAYGISSDAIDEYRRPSGSSAMNSLKEFTKAVVEECGPEYLRSPTEKDLQRLLRPNTARRFPKMVASIDYQHYEWKACLTRQAGGHKRKVNKPSVVLEGVADGEGPIWFMYFGLPGALNDINVLDKSLTMGKIIIWLFSPSHGVRRKWRGEAYALRSSGRDLPRFRRVREDDLK